MKLYLIRHGKTEWNLERRYQGANGDSPLLPQSYEDIKQLASFIKGISFDALFTSPLKRTITTSKELLKALNQTQVLITEDDRLKEFGLGDLEGRTFTECSKKIILVKSKLFVKIRQYMTRLLLVVKHFNLSSHEATNLSRKS